MENREKLLSCALDLFYARGYDAVGIQEIVDAAGVTKPTMYYYFGSKKGLLEDLIQGIFNDLMEALGHACARRPEDHFPDILFRIAGAFLRYAVSHEKEYRFVLALYYTGEENGIPTITFDKSSDSIDSTIKEFDRVVEKIQNKDFSERSKDRNLCANCDMRYFCKRYDRENCLSKWNRREKSDFSGGLPAACI